MTAGKDDNDDMKLLNKKQNVINNYLVTAFKVFHFAETNKYKLRKLVESCKITF